jgi:hypothetical protein
MEVSAGMNMGALANIGLGICRSAFLERGSGQNLERRFR